MEFPGFGDRQLSKRLVTIELPKSHLHCHRITPAVDSETRERNLNHEGPGLPVRCSCSGFATASNSWASAPGSSNCYDVRTRVCQSRSLQTSAAKTQIAANPLAPSEVGADAPSCEQHSFQCTSAFVDNVERVLEGQQRLLYTCFHVLE